MVQSVKHFDSQIYGEYLEEASFLYGQRLACLQDSGVSWQDVGDIERRFDTQVQAVTEGQAAALEVCREMVKDGGAGVLHSAVRVYCRLNRQDLVFEVLSHLDGDDPEVSRAVAQALRQEILPAWKTDILRLFQGNHQHLNGVLGHVIGYRRFPAEDVLVRKLQTKPEAGIAEVTWALGRVGSSTSIPVLRELLEHEDEAVCESTAIALMRLGDSLPLQSAVLSAQTKSWPHRVLGIGGDARSVSVLLDALKSDDVNKNVVLALGLLGDLVAVSQLLAKLDSEDLAEFAAIALNTITGAGLYTEMLKPDEVGDVSDGNEVDSETIEKLPTREDGEPFGSWELSPVCQSSEWRLWLEENKSRFNRQFRWRMGKPHGPEALLDCLREKMSPYEVRAASYDELVVRYGLTVPFEVDLPVQQQHRYLAVIDKWVRENSKKFPPAG